MDFDRYTTGQALLGLKSLVLDTLFQDPSMLRELLTMAFFQRMGQPAPRESFCRLYINNVYQGLYAIVEEIDERFLARAVGDSAGYLFEYHYVVPFYGEFLGDDLNVYKPLFEPRTHERESDAALYGPISDLFRVINSEDDGSWRDRVARYLDLEDFITLAAIENFVAENDRITGYAGMNNFYLYREAASLRHRLVMWDKDNAFHQSARQIPLRIEENVVLRRAFRYPDLRERYLLVLEAAARMAASDAWLDAKVNRTIAPIDASVREDRRKPFSNAEFDDAIVALKQFAATRAEFVLQEVTRLRQQP